MSQDRSSLPPLVAETVQAGFPSPAESCVEGQLDLNELVVQHKAATFFIRVRGDSMVGASIHSGDLLVVDRALKAKAGHIVVALLEGEFTVKRLVQREGVMWLQAEHPNYPSFRLTEERECSIWGVVTYVLHALT